MCISNTYICIHMYIYLYAFGQKTAKKRKLTSQAHAQNFLALPLLLSLFLTENSCVHARLCVCSVLGRRRRRRRSAMTNELYQALVYYTRERTRVQCVCEFIKYLEIKKFFFFSLVRFGAKKLEFFFQYSDANYFLPRKQDDEFFKKKKKKWSHVSTKMENQLCFSCHLVLVVLFWSEIRGKKKKKNYEKCKNCTTPRLLCSLTIEIILGETKKYFYSRCCRLK